MKRNFKKARPRRKAGASKHDQITQQILKQIEEGILPPGMRLPPDSDLHRTFKVAKPTLVRALNELAKQGWLVRRRGLGTYVTARRTPSILPERPLRLCIAWHGDISKEGVLYSYQGAMSRAVLDAWGLGDIPPEIPTVSERQPTRAVWSARDRNLTVECIGRSAFSRTRRPPLEMLTERAYDGIMLMSIIESDWIGQVLNLGKPTVVVDFPCDALAHRADQVFVDPSSGYRQAVQYLVAQGLKRIHFVGARLPIPAPHDEMSHDEWYAMRHPEDKSRIEPDTVLRQSIVRQAMFECGMELPARWVHSAGPGSRRFFELTERLATLPDSERPEAVVCHSIEQAELLIKAFAKHGHRLVAMGAADAPHSGMALPIHADTAAMGTTSAEVLAMRLHHPNRQYLRVGVLMEFTAPGAAKP